VYRKIGSGLDVYRKIGSGLDVYRKIGSGLDVYRKKTVCGSLMWTAAGRRTRTKQVC